MNSSAPSYPPSTPASFNASLPIISTERTIVLATFDHIPGVNKLPRILQPSTIRYTNDLWSLRRKRVVPLTLRRCQWFRTPMNLSLSDKSFFSVSLLFNLKIQGRSSVLLARSLGKNLPSNLSLIFLIKFFVNRICCFNNNYILKLSFQIRSSRKFLYIFFKLKNTFLIMSNEGSIESSTMTNIA